MEPYYVQMEVLLLRGTSLTSGNFCKKDDPGNDDQLSEKDRLLEACWNGLLQTMLPEINTQSAGGGTLYLWQINEAAAFLELELGEVPAEIDNRFSITPHLFLSSQSYN